MVETEVVGVRLPTETVSELRAIAKSKGTSVSKIVRTRLEAPAAPPTLSPLGPIPIATEKVYLPCGKGCEWTIPVTRDRAADLIRRGVRVSHPPPCPEQSSRRRGWWGRG